MCRLSKREKEVLEACLTAADDTVVAANLGISQKQVRVHKTRARRKIARAQNFLRDMKQYREVLYPRKKYKGM